jgi:thiamine pyrophosphokinase
MCTARAGNNTGGETLYFDSVQLLKYVVQQYDIILLGGLSGRLDQTIGTLSCVHQLRKSRTRVFVVTDDNVGWVLDTVWFP